MLQSFRTLAQITLPWARLVGELGREIVREGRGRKGGKEEKKKRKEKRPERDIWRGNRETLFVLNLSESTESTEYADLLLFEPLRPSWIEFDWFLTPWMAEEVLSSIVVRVTDIIRTVHGI